MPANKNVLKHVHPTQQTCWNRFPLPAAEWIRRRSFGGSFGALSKIPRICL